MITNYNLTTLVDGDTSVVDGIAAGSPEQAIAFAAGILTERVKGHETMFMSPGVRWTIDTAVMDLENVTMLPGEVIGMFDLVLQAGQPRLVWTTA